MPDRSISTEIPPNTLTPSELERAVQLQDELRAMVSETPLMDMSDTEYARAKQLESALEGIVDNATTGTRGEIRDEIIARKTRSELASAQEALADVEDDLESFYWTQASRFGDEELREEIRQQILIQQTQNQPEVLTEVRRVVNPETGETEMTSRYEPGSIDQQPVRVPKPAQPIEPPFIDNLDGTMTIPSPPLPPVTVQEDSLSNLGLPEAVIDEYREVVESNNGIRLQQYLDTLPTEQADILYQQSSTGNLVNLPGSTTTIPSGYEKFEPESVRQLQAALSIYDNITNQIRSLPKIEVVDQYGTDYLPDWTKMQDVRYVDADGTVKTISAETLNMQQFKWGWTPTASEHVKNIIAQDFTNIDVGYLDRNNNSENGNTRLTISPPVFSINEDNEE
jgi:hypothetical protein